MTEIVVPNSLLVPAQKSLHHLATEDLEIGVSLKWAAAKTAQEVGRLIELLGKQETELFKKYAALDDAGEFIPAVDAEGKLIPQSWRFKENTVDVRKAFAAEYDELMAAKNVLVGEKVGLSRLEKSGLTGVQLLALEPWIDPSA